MVLKICVLMVFIAADILLTNCEESPKIIKAPQDQKVQDNGIASFDCIATGTPVPEIHWRKGRKRISGNQNRFLILNETRPGTSVLRIEPVKSARRDDGVFECRAENGVGEPAVASAKLEVYSSSQEVPSGFPHVTESPSLKAVEKDRSVVLPCVVTGNPTPVVRWFKDFVPIDSTDDRISVLPTGSLQIQRVAETDEGKYECAGENNFGIAFSYMANLYVRVRRVVPHFATPPENVEVMPGGNANLTCIAIGSPMPLVKWRLGPHDLSPEENLPIGKNVLVLTDIQDSANYTCVAVSTLGTVEAHAEVKVKALSRPPFNLQATEVTPNSIKLTWDSVDPVESFIVQYRRKHSTKDAHEEVTDIVGFEYTLSSLAAHTAYQIEVIAINNIGRSLPSNPIDVTTQEDAPGSPPQNVRARPVSASTVVVQWEEPKTPNGIIKGYKVYYTLKPSQPISTWTIHTVDSIQLTTIGNLVTNRTYTVAVLAFTNAGDGPFSDGIQVKTQQGVPEQPSNLKAEVLSEQAIQLSWDVPGTSGESLESYELYYNDTSSGAQSLHITISPPSNSYLLEDLTPNTEYRMMVSAKSTRGEGALSSPVVAKTMEAAPSAPPQNVNGETMDSVSFKVTWSAPPKQHWNGELVGYRVLYTEAGSGHKGIDDPSTVMATVPSTELSYIVRGLRKWTEYNVWVLAYTIKGDGPHSDTIVVQTAEDVPGEPRKVKVEAINSSAISVQWRPPHEKEQNGAIRGYQIYYSSLNDNDEANGMTSMHDVMEGSATEAVIGNLLSDTQYQVQVAAFTRKGDGERTRPKKVRTKGAVLGPPRNLQLTLSQQDPPAVMVTWQAPRNAHSGVLGYKVEFAIRGSDTMEERMLEAEKYKFTTNFLDRGVEYEFRVSARNVVDWGEAAVAVIPTPEGIPAGSPLNASATDVTSTSARLQWEIPMLQHRNGKIVLYEIMYREQHNYVDDLTTNSTDTSMMIDGLEPAKDYVFQIRAYTSQGCGPWSGPVEVSTLAENALSPPSNVVLKRTSSSVMEVNWVAPPGGQVSGYQVFYSMYAASDVSKWQHKETGPYTATTVENLQPKTVYAVMIRSKAKDGRVSEFSKVVIENEPDPDKDTIDAVRDFYAEKPNPKTPRSLKLEWAPPRKVGVLYYKIEFEGTKTYRNAEGNEKPAVHREEKNVSRDAKSVSLDELKPATLYRFSISAKFMDGVLGATKSILVQTEVDAPPEIRPPVFERFTSDTSALVRLFPASELNGVIIRYYLVVVPLEVYELKNSTNEFSTDELLVPDEVSHKPSWVIAAFISLPPEFNIGNGSSNKLGRFVNRPLARGRHYRVFVRAYTSENKYTSSPYLEIVIKDKPVVMEVVPYGQDFVGLELLWIVAPICGAVVLILLIVLIIVFLRRRSCKKDDRYQRSPKILIPAMNDYTIHPHDPVELRRLHFQTPGMVNHPPIAIARMGEIMDRLKLNDGDGFSREYESIEPGQQFTWEASNKEENKGKNRYANVVAYDHSRVVLLPLDDIPCSDYINANYMDGYCKNNAYIATQGPLPDTIADFWRMVWEQQSSTIVMMTKLEERNRIKCDQYWPNRGTEIYGVIQVTVSDIVELATFTIRTFQISQVNYLEKRTVNQLQFTAWPDHGVPTHPTPLLNFIRRVKAINPIEMGPVVVHCSAGVGRTGAFIVIDAMLDRIQHEKTLDVYGHVTCLRAQRNYMVQTEDQYVFIYDALLEAIESGNTEIPADSLYPHVHSLTQVESDQMITGMEYEFKKLNNARVCPSLLITANLPINKHKNRLVNILPFESTRVCLQPIRGVDGSDYINANFIDGYRFRRAFIATQAPMSETTEDFWRMLWENNCTIVVMMVRLKELGREVSHQYWPEERSARYQYFVVDPVAQYNMPLYILREFKVTDARDGQSRIVRQFQFTDWPDQGVPLSGEGFIEFIGHIQKTKEQFGQDGPIAVHCSMGVGRTGVFIALSIALERMRYEGVIDLFQTVKMLRTQRPAMVQTEDQYAFCYRAALEYLSSFDHYAS